MLAWGDQVVVTETGRPGAHLQAYTGAAPAARQALCDTMPFRKGHHIRTQMCFPIMTEPQIQVL